MYLMLVPDVLPNNQAQTSRVESSRELDPVPPKVGQDMEREREMGKRKEAPSVIASE